MFDKIYGKYVSSNALKCDERIPACRSAFSTIVTYYTMNYMWHSILKFYLDETDCSKIFKTMSD